MKKVNLTYLVDDDEIILYLTEKAIRKHNFSQQLEKFSNSESSLERLRFALKVNENIPDLILYDWKMNPMKGKFFMNRINELSKVYNVKIPLFVFTSAYDIHDEDKCSLQPCISGFIAKPLSLVKLNKILRLMGKDELLPNNTLRYYNIPQAI